MRCVKVNVRQSRLFSFVVPRWWNELPSTTRAGVSLSTFKKLLKTQLFREYLPSRSEVRHSRLFSFVVPRWWNELPSTTRAGVSLSTFKKLLKTQLFREYLPS